MSEPSNIITVSELTFAVKNQLESRFNSVTVQGEISNAKLQSSGHLYFDLKDAHSKISAVMFRSHSQKLARFPKEGDQVVIKGALSVYPPHGKYQIVAHGLDYLGVGELLLKLEFLKKKLQSKGWFDKERKKTLPSFPKTIGVVTSPTGAVIRDIIHVLSRRFSGFHLILYPVRVQGVEAPFEIAKAIEEFNKYQLADVLIVGRGGGSLEDLWAFNEEIVAKAIFESSIPIISAVGHETDITIADFVADVRAPTPSAAAEIVSAEKNQFVQSLSKFRQSFSNTLMHLVKWYRSRLEHYERHPRLSTPSALLSEPMQKLDEIKLKLDEKMRQEIVKRRYLLLGRQKQAFALKPGSQIELYRSRLEQNKKRIDMSSKNSLDVRKQKLKNLTKHLASLDPKNVLQRGYSILFAEKGGSVIVSRQQLIPGQILHALLSDGEANLWVKENE